MKYYIVGFDTGKVSGRKVPVALGDALVYASTGREALTKVREAGLVPNPGDIYILGGKGYMKWHEPNMEILEKDEELKDRAREEGVAIIWSSWP